MSGPFSLNKKYQDLINFNPHIIVNIDKKQRQLIEQHYLIINALKTKNMTVKEIHGLYFDDQEGKYSKTLKTIYRYINKLEDANIVSVAGQRMTEGSRIIERVYCLSANYYYFIDPPLKWWESQEATEFSKNLGFALSKLLDKPIFEKEESIDLIYQISRFEAEIDYFNTLEIIENIKNNPELNDIFYREYNKDVHFVSHLSKLIKYIRNMGLIGDLQKLNDMEVENLDL